MDLAGSFLICKRGSLIDEQNVDLVILAFFLFYQRNPRICELNVSLGDFAF